MVPAQLPQSLPRAAGRRSQRAVALIVVGALTWIAPPAEARAAVSGQVCDAESGQVVAHATIAEAGARTGAVTDSAGVFRLAVSGYPAQLVVEAAGYRARQLSLAAPPAAPLQVRLDPEPYEMAETLVQYEDPAVAIMAEVIRRKRTWQARLRTWTARAYTRQTLYSDTRIAAIREQRSRYYSDRERGRREVVEAAAHTPGVPPSLRYFPSRAYFVNLYADEIEVLGQRFPGPTHPEAPGHYRFELVGRRAAAGDSLYAIAVRPRRLLGTALAGYVLVADDSSGLVEASLAVAPPIVSARLPSQDGLHVHFRQRFAAFAAGVRLPVQLQYEIDARLGTSALAERVRRLRNDPTPRARLVGRCRLEGHRVNGRTPDFVYRSPGPLEVDGLATADSLTRPQEMGLTEREAEAGARLERVPQPLGRVPAVGLYALYPGLPRPPPEPARTDPFEAESLVDDEVVVAAVERGLGVPVPARPDGDWVPELAPEVWYNRAAGAHAGGRARLDRPRWGLHLEGGYDFGPERLYRGAAVTLGAAGGPTVTFSHRAGTRTTYPSRNYTLAGNSFAVLLGIDDYFDYYWSRAWRLEVGAPGAGPDLDLTAGLNRERHTSLAKSTDFDLLCDFQPESGRFYEWVCEGGDHDLRPNPPIRPGRLQSLDLRAVWGGPYAPRGLGPNRRLELFVEHGGGRLGGDYDFSRAQVAVDGHWDTILGRRASAGGLDLRLVGGVDRGRVPPQRSGAVDVAIWRFTPFGGLRTRRHRPLAGGRYAAAFWEQDFGTAPFELVGLRGLARAGTRLVLQGASARVWRGSGRGAHPHHEVGISAVVDGRWRLDVTRRLDRRGWWVGFSKARRGP